MSITPSTEQKRRKEWTEELRSGKYGQCKGTLNNGHGEFCCLGVGTDLFHEATGKGRWTSTSAFILDGQDVPESACFPNEVHQYFGLIHSNPSFTIQFVDENLHMNWNSELEDSSSPEWLLSDGTPPPVPSGMSVCPDDLLRGPVFVSNYSLAQLNDSGFTFEQIADIIDYFFNDDSPVTRENVVWNKVSTPVYTTLAVQEVK